MLMAFCLILMMNRWVIKICGNEKKGRMRKVGWENLTVQSWEKFWLTLFPMTCIDSRLGSNKSCSGLISMGDCRFPLLHNDQLGLINSQYSGPVTRRNKRYH